MTARPPARVTRARYSPPPASPHALGHQSGRRRSPRQTAGIDEQLWEGLPHLACVLKLILELTDVAAVGAPRAPPELAQIRRVDQQLPLRRQRCGESGEQRNEPREGARGRGPVHECQHRVVGPLGIEGPQVADPDVAHAPGAQHRGRAREQLEGRHLVTGLLEGKRQGARGGSHVQDAPRAEREGGTVGRSQPRTSSKEEGHGHLLFAAVVAADRERPIGHALLLVTQRPLEWRQRRPEVRPGGAPERSMVAACGSFRHLGPETVRTRSAPAA